MARQNHTIDIISARRDVFPDSKGRVLLGKFLDPDVHYKVSKDKKNRIILEPYVDIPAHELWLWKNKKAMNSIDKGMKELNNGKKTTPSSNVLADIQKEIENL